MWQVCNDVIERFPQIPLSLKKIPAKFLMESILLKHF